MLRLKRWIAAALAASVLINTIPLNAFAETEEQASIVESISEVDEPASTGQSVLKTVESTAEDTQTTQTSQEMQETETGKAITGETETQGVESRKAGIQETETGGTETQEVENRGTETGGTEIQRVKSQETENIGSLQGTGNTDSSQNTQESMELLLKLEETSEASLSEAQGENETQTASEGGIPTIGDTFADKFIGVLNEKNISTTIAKDEKGIITLTIGQGQGEILALLSQQTQTEGSNYQNWNIKFDFTGILTLPDAYRGLGDEGIPFKGKFTNQAITIKTSKTLFKALDASADLFGVKIEWEIGTNDATPTIPILTNVLVADVEGHTINMPLTSANRFNPYIGKLTGGNGQITLPALNYTNVGTSPAVEYPGDVGLVCCSMDTGTNLKVGDVTLPSSVPLNLKGSGNVGSLVGSMGEGATLTISENMTLNGTLNGANAGGLVGSMTNATIDCAEEKTVSVNATLTATDNAAGGIAGVVAIATGALGTNANVVLQSVKANGMQNSGVLYGSCTVTGNFDPIIGVTFSDSASAVREVSGSGNCGGMFGTLTLQRDGKCTISAKEISSTLTSVNNNTNNNTQYGGIVGTLSGDERKNALVVDRCNVTSTVNVGTDKSSYPKFVGGIVAVQGVNTTVDTKESIVTLSNPRTPVNTYGIGGLCASVGDGALLQANTMTVVIDSFLENQGSSGVAASTGKGTVVYLENRLDLSRCLLTTCAYSGQIIGKQDCSLIYAPNVKIDRLKTTYGTTSYSGVELDDIGNYGELYRIDSTDPVDSGKKPFLSIGEDYSVTFNYKLVKGDTGYTLSSKEDYACLALAWQARGYFLTVDGITKDNWSTLKSSTITIGNNISLNGCGIGGLTRDVYSEDDIFTGIFNGNDKNLTMDIGAANVANDVTTGDGRIYWHNSTGLFAAIDNAAIVKNLTLDGSIRLSNNKLGIMYSGALAAQMRGNRAEGSTLSKVSTSVKYGAKVNGGNTLYLGGLIGQIIQGSSCIDLDAGTNLSAQIEISHSGNGSFNHIGGAIGGIGAESDANIICSGVTIGGSIKSINSVNNFYAGGLLGTILPSSKTRIIRITKLTVDGFALTGNVSGRMGGILGGIWADTDVTVDDLTVRDTALTASGNANLGGLVYRASGKWTVKSADLNGLTINASNASALGLLICQGEPYKDIFNGSYQVMNGLYLEMNQYWETGYQVPGVINFDGSVFDEFVAYTAYRNTDTNYDITHNGGGIISLHTDNSTVNMTGGERNTYNNRTSMGQSKKTNLYSRYYYNLPEVKNKCTGGNIDIAEELLIWSVYRYAATNLKQYFAFSGIADNKGNAVSDIGGTPSSRATFNMEGLSYYPINITNENVNVYYADVKFYNDDIEAKEKKNNENKLTSGNMENHSQHYTMHCALFLNFTAEAQSITENEQYKMTVNGVTFAGTVGVTNGGSGVLLCGTVKGESISGNTVTCTVILADDDDDARAVSLNGLSVVPEGDYTPVLINKFGSYAGLTANYVTITNNQTTEAGSSLIGNVGDEGATGVSIVFAGTIKLQETDVFTKATLLNSLRYSSGLAIYNFYKSNDYNGEEYEHNATHGKELSTTVEYAGKQGCYYDGYGLGYFISTNRSFDAQNDFSLCLPYVAFSPATGDTEHKLENGWHEIAVNVLSPDITEGCGTYGHPYKVNANLLMEAAKYINTGSASNNWELRIPIGNAQYHRDCDGQDVLVTYTEGVWKAGETTYTDEYIRKHLQSAYYAITDDIELANFSGIGTNPDWAFMGVITGKKSDGSNPNVTLTGGSAAFIKYSYGSVVRDVSFTLQQNPTLTWSGTARTASGTTQAQQAPTTFFGGVIGCVLGGDNIIENVLVSGGNEVSVDNSNQKAHLVPVGGYVGVIAGGGVVFRGMYSDNTGITATNVLLYRNPVIGRVLGGYAFYEGDGEAPDNGDKDYKINKITPVAEDSEKDLSWTNGNLTVNTKQGLLILSAIVSSGAGSTESNAYLKGVVRNATYNQIGEVADLANEDFILSNSDTVNSVPYLLKLYAGCTAPADICAKSSDTTGITIKFAPNATFDMSVYGNGYRGLSARYVSNAAFSGSTVTPSSVVLRVKTFDGQNTTVKGIDMDVKEYSDDDFHMASMGGIFNIVWTQKQSGGGEVGSNFAQNLTLTNRNVSLKYVNNEGIEQNEADITTFSNEDGRRAVSVGGFIGMANDVEATQSSIKHNYLFKNIHIDSSNQNTKCKISGPNSVGGLIGTTAMASTGVTGYPGKLLANGKWALFGPNFLNCSYSNIEVTGGLAAGGLVGDAYANGSSTVPSFSGLGLAYSSGNFRSYTSCTVTDQDLIVGQNATITARAKASIAGGLFGGAGMRVGVNDPSVNSNSGISIVNSTGEIRPLCLKKVYVWASVTDYDPGSTDRPDSGINNAYAAGIIGRIGNVNPSCFFDIRIRDGSVISTLASSSRVGGIQGSGYTNSAITIERCEISSFKLSGANTGGFLGTGQAPSGFALYMSDCKLEESSIYGSSTAGGLVGDAQSFYYLHNILIKNTSITSKTSYAGRLFGKMTINAAGDNFGVYAAGISVYADTDSNQNYQIPEEDGNTDGKTYTGYIAYTDYAGTDTKIEGYKSPYVTVNPNYTLTADKMLTGDAVGKMEGDTYGSVAVRIWADSQTNATEKKNLASYTRASAIVNVDGKTKPEVFTFQEVQGYTDQEWRLADLPVLVLKGNDVSAIEDYLDVITNGGYSTAKEAGNVTTQVSSVYYYNKENGIFSEATSQQLKDNPASIYYENGQFYIRSRTFDNTLDRFSLVEASFTVKVNNVDRTYTVSLPVVVIRELQYDFMATFSYGREFNKNTFNNLNTHLLESTGNPFTAYLTYQYNREKTNYVEYDWQTYMDDGGSMLEVDKALSFSSGLPAETQMVLMDCQNGNQAYQYTISGANTKDVRLGNFISLADGTTFQSSMAEILGVTATGNNTSGKFVETDKDNPNVTARIKGAGNNYVYYRPYNSETDSGKNRFDLTVPDLSKKTSEENYYLVITVPDQSNPNFYLNGSLSSSLAWTMPSSGTQLHRYDTTKVDDRNNTESTYQISTGYRQALVSTAQEDRINLSNTDQKMQVKVQDTITFSNGQTYGDNDQLFLKFMVNLQEYMKSGDNTTSEEKQFPVGTTGTVKFYVQDGTKTTYYAWNNERNEWISQDSATVAASYLWESKGATMELLLSADGNKALDLSSVRKLIKGSNESGDSDIIVTAEMDIEFGGSEVLNAAVPGSDQNGTDTWVQLHYLGQISTQATSLNHSAMRATANDNARYYRGVSYQAVLSMDAMQIDQLGVNPLQLVQDYQETIGGRNASRINLTAVLNLTNLQDIESVLGTTDSITFKLTLQRRNGDNYEDVTGSSDYITFDKGTFSDTNNNWSWTISQDAYYKDGQLVTGSVFDGAQFTIPIKAYVFNDQKNYANYKIKLTVSFAGSSVAITDAEANVIYTFACIKPSFYEPAG